MAAKPKVNSTLDPVLRGARHRSNDGGRVDKQTKMNR